METAPLIKIDIVGNKLIFFDNCAINYICICSKCKNNLLWAHCPEIGAVKCNNINLSVIGIPENFIEATGALRSRIIKILENKEMNKFSKLIHICNLYYSIQVANLES